MHELFAAMWFWVRLAKLTDRPGLDAAPRIVALDPDIVRLVHDAILPDLLTTSSGEEAT